MHQHTDAYHISVYLIHLISTFPFTYLSVRPSIHPPTQPFIQSLFHLRICLFVHPSIHPFIQSTLPFTYLSVRPSTQPFIQSLFHLRIYLFIHPSSYPPIHPPILPSNPLFYLRICLFVHPPCTNPSCIHPLNHIHSTLPFTYPSIRPFIHPTTFIK